MPDISARRYKKLLVVEVIQFAQHLSDELLAPDYAYLGQRSTLPHKKLTP